MDTPRPSPRTNRTRRVPHPVLIGHAASLSQVACPRDTLSGAGVEGGRASPCEGQEGGGADVVGVVLDDVLLNQAGALRPAPRGVVDRSAETGQQN